MSCKCKETVKILMARKSEEVIMPTKIRENIGFDVYAFFEEDEMRFEAHETKLVPTGLHSCVSENWGLIAKERGSTGSIGLKCGAGVIDSGYRGEIFIALTNDNNCPLVISKHVSSTNVLDDKVIYPYSKGIAQLMLVSVPDSEIVEISVDELKAIPSVRGEGKIGSTNK